MGKISISQDVTDLNGCICEVILEAAKQSVQRTEGKYRKKIVLWWTKECDNVVLSVIKNSQFLEFD